MNQLHEAILTFYGTWKFTALFTRARQMNHLHISRVCISDVHFNVLKPEAERPRVLFPVRSLYFGS